MRPAEGDEGPAYAASGSPRVWPEIEALRASAGRLAAEEAEQLRLVVQLVRRSENEARVLLACGPRVSGQPADDLVLASEVGLEVKADADAFRRRRAQSLAERAVRA